MGLQLTRVRVARRWVFRFGVYRLPRSRLASLEKRLIALAVERPRAVIREFTSTGSRPNGDLNGLPTSYQVDRSSGLAEPRLL